ncbi:tetratricopeptide repeat protein [Streptomyces sp. YC537]|uniref:Tetratricopeptide repeat protein n=2 Tax=Streptomyces boluensis TaxID=1775135 RepID=A0A964UME9_9ACTN|nr:tetratricopeptide repeat protein [Streptomyces boluensis]
MTEFFARRRRGSGGSGGSGGEDELEASRRALEEAQELGDDDAADRVVESLRERLRHALAADSQAEQELRRLLEDLTPIAQHATVSGPQGTVVQAAQIRDIYFQAPALPETGQGVKPDQVPPQTVRFVNRTADLSTLGAWFTEEGAAAPTRVGVGVLDGLPGVGKSATAREYAHRFKDRYPDGQIYVDFADLRGSGRGGADVSEAVGMGLRALGVSDANIPRTLAERTSLFRSRSAGLRLLVLLDDVDQPAQVRALVPKEPGSVVLATSTIKLGELAAFDGARLLSLRPLDADHALHLLADRCGPDAVERERTAAERLVELCGRLPVALHVVASRVQMTPGLTFEALADVLDEESGRLSGLSLGGEHSMSAIFTDAYRQLPADTARFFRLLGWLPGTAFDAGLAAAAADIDATTSQQLLAALQRASLVEPTGDGRYRMHGLVRLYARERAAEEEPQGAHKDLIERVATQCLALAAFADRAQRQDRLRIADLDALLARSQNPFAAEGAPLPLHWLDAERATILAVLREASEHQLHGLVWPLAEAFTVLFLHHRHLGEWKESLELGAAAAAAAVVPAAEARLRSLLSRPLMDLGEYDRARTELEAAAACADIAQQPELTASVMEFTGRYWDRFDPSRAIEAYERAIEVNAEAEEWRGVAIVRYFLGCAQSALGDHEAALSSLHDARQRLTALDDRRMAARATLALGVTHDRLGHPDEAADFLRSAAAVLKQKEAHHYEAEALVALADVEERAGATADVVREHLTRASKIYDDTGSPLAEALRVRLEGGGGAAG